jgi:hypothetical protein
MFFFIFNLPQPYLFSLSSLNISLSHTRPAASPAPFSPTPGQLRPRPRCARLSRPRRAPPRPPPAPTAAVAASPALDRARPGGARRGRRRGRLSRLRRAPPPCSPSEPASTSLCVASTPPKCRTPVLPLGLRCAAACPSPLPLRQVWPPLEAPFCSRVVPCSPDGCGLAFAAPFATRSGAAAPARTVQEVLHALLGVQLNLGVAYRLAFGLLFYCLILGSCWRVTFGGLARECHV